ERIQALSDGVFAIAMTLLIFNIKIPQEARTVNQLATKLAELTPNFVTYVLSFISLGIYWVGHHNMYHSIRKTDRPLLWINILFLMMVAFLPFSTNLVGLYASNQLAIEVFG